MAVSTAAASFSIASPVARSSALECSQKSRVSLALKQNFTACIDTNSSFSGQKLHVSSTSSRSSASRKGSMVVSASVAGSKKSVMIVNTNSGGHAVIGFWAAKLLAEQGHLVTILTIGEESSDKMKKPPFTRFDMLREAGVKTIWGQPSDLSKLTGYGARFDVVLDNNGKDLDTVKPVIDWAKSAKASQFLFISSAGIYKPSDEQPHLEGDEVKSSAGHVAVEKALAKEFPSAWASFRPQYITGPGNNKDCEEYFFDRIVRGRPLLIPSPGLQLTVITHVQDIATMLTAAVANPQAAGGQVFNAVGDRVVTFDGLARMCAKAANRDGLVKIVHYDPKKAGVDAKKAFPFRNMHFYAYPQAAKEKLGWQSSVNLQKALDARYVDYINTGRVAKEMAFELDDKILASL